MAVDGGALFHEAVHRSSQPIARGMSDSQSNPRKLRIAGLAAGSGFGVVVALAVLSAIFPQAGLRDFFSPGCHQQDDRSHWLLGEPFAVCLRCFWLYVGLAVGHLRFVVRPVIPRGRLVFLCLTGAFIGLNWLEGWLNILPDFPLLRAASGFLFGFAVTSYSAPGVAEWLRLGISQPQPQPQTTAHTYEPIRP